MKKIYLLLCAGILAAQPLSAQTLYPTGANGCIARWDFSSTTANPATVTDASGNGNNGQATNLQAAVGFRPGNNRAMQFNGLNSQAVVPHAPILTTGAVTMIGLVKFNDFYAGPCQLTQLLSKGTHYENGTYGVCIQDNLYDNSCQTYSPDYMQFLPTAASSAYQVYATLGNFVQKNTWYFIAVTYDGSAVYEYMVKMDSTTVGSIGNPIFSRTGLSDPIGSNLKAITIGSLTGTTYWFNGVMDEMALFNRALSQAEIDDIYKFLWKDGRLDVTEAHTRVLQETVFVNNKVVSATLPGTTDFELQVLNLNGQIIARSTMQSGTVELDLSHVPAGLLLYRIVSENGATATGKLLNR